MFGNNCSRVFRARSTWRSAPGTREPWITPDLTPKLYDTIHGIVAGPTGVLLAAGGVADHVHLLVTLGRETSVSEPVRLVICNSSKWVHETFAAQRESPLEKPEPLPGLCRGHSQAVAAGRRPARRAGGDRPELIEILGHDDQALAPAAQRLDRGPGDA